MPQENMKYLDKSMKYLHRQGAFLTVCDDKGNENVMTISWGNIGYEWGRTVFTILIRNSRYTSKIIENAKEFVVSIPTTSEAKPLLAKVGSRTGKDMDKFKEFNLTKGESKIVKVPFIKEANIIYECRIVYKHKIDQNILHDDLKLTSYMDGDYHTIYYGEILDCYLNE